MNPTNATDTIPVSPPKDWGIKTRKHTLSDWKDTINFGAISLTALLLVAGIFMNQGLLKKIVPENALSHILIGGGFVVFVLTVVTLVMAIGANGLPERQAQAARAEAAKEWEKETLIPFLEKRYGFTIFADGSILRGYRKTEVKYKDRYFAIRIHGVKVNYHNIDSDEWFVTIDPKQFRVDEIVNPAEVSFRPLEVV